MHQGVSTTNSINSIAQVSGGLSAQLNSSSHVITHSHSTVVGSIVSKKTTVLSKFFSYVPVIAANSKAKLSILVLSKILGAYLMGFSYYIAPLLFITIPFGMLILASSGLWPDNNHPQSPVNTPLLSHNGSSDHLENTVIQQPDQQISNSGSQNLIDSY